MDIKNIAKDIIELNFEKTDTVAVCLNKFYDVLRKHNIKQGTPIFNDDGKEIGSSCNNYEWTMCKNLFLGQLESFIDFDMLINIPQDLLK